MEERVELERLADERAAPQLGEAGREPVEHRGVAVDEPAEQRGELRGLGGRRRRRRRACISSGVSGQLVGWLAGRLFCYFDKGR